MKARLVILVVCCVAGSAQGAELGTSLSSSYFLKAEAPAGWFIAEGRAQEYEIAATMYISQGPLRFALQPYLFGDHQPRLAGAYLGLGWDFGGATISLFHHSCHNLDVKAQVLYRQNFTHFGEPPACDFDGINLRINMGRTFAPLW